MGGTGWSDGSLGWERRDRARSGAIGHLSGRLATRSSRRLVEAALIERVATLPGDPTLLCATRQGIAYAGLVCFRRRTRARSTTGSPAPTSPFGPSAPWGPDSLMSERELRFAELDAPKPIASAIVGELPDGRPMLHRPDLVVRDDGHTIAIEVELTPKAPRRLEHIVRSWRRARYIESVLYMVPRGPTQRAVERAVAATHAQERVILRSWGAAR